jgi:uncharacterized integral membrane protein
MSYVAYIVTIAAVALMLILAWQNTSAWERSFVEHRTSRVP